LPEKPEMSDEVDIGKESGLKELLLFENTKHNNYCRNDERNCTRFV